MNAPVPELVNCPHCGAKNPVIEERCQECDRPLAVFIGPPAKVRRIGLGALMLLIAEIAVCLAVLRELPGLGVLMLLILVPAQVRTLVAVARRKADERPMTREETLGVFFSSMAVMVLIGVVAGVTLATSYAIGFWAGAGLGSIGPTPLGMWDWGFVGGAVLGTLATSVVVVRLIRRLWDVKD